MAGDPYEISDADTMLEYLAPDASKPLDVTVPTRKGCSFCAKAKAQLREAGIEFEELVLNRDYSDRSLRAITGKASVPQIFINTRHIGDSKALEDWLGARQAA